MFTAKVIFLAFVAVCYGAPNAKFSSKGLKIYPKLEDYPFIASIQYCHPTYGYCYSICGGVIANKNWVLTSTSCIHEARKVIVGDLRGNESVSVNIAAIYSYPNSTNMSGPNDLALFKLAEDLTFNHKVQPAKLPTQGQEFSGTADWVGYATSFLPNQNFLNGGINDTLISNDDCKKAIKSFVLNVDGTLYDSNICTLSKAATTSLGDVGGPLSQNGTVIGTVSWYISPTSLVGGPNVYTKLSNFIDWIEKTIAENN